MMSWSAVRVSTICSEAMAMTRCSAGRTMTGYPANRATTSCTARRVATGSSAENTTTGYSEVPGWIFCSESQGTTTSTARMRNRA
jgi:hypothetical protein